MWLKIWNKNSLKYRDVMGSKNPKNHSDCATVSPLTTMWCKNQQFGANFVCLCLHMHTAQGGAEFKLNFMEIRWHASMQKYFWAPFWAISCQFERILESIIALYPMMYDCHDYCSWNCRSSGATKYKNCLFRNKHFVWSYAICNENASILNFVLSKSGYVWSSSLTP